MAKGGIEARWRARDGLIQLAQLTSRAIERREPARAAGAGGRAGRALGRHRIGPAADGSSGLRASAPAPARARCRLAAGCSSLRGRLAAASRPLRTLSHPRRTLRTASHPSAPLPHPSAPLPHPSAPPPHPSRRAFRRGVFRSASRRFGPRGPAGVRRRCARRGPLSGTRFSR